MANNGYLVGDSCLDPSLYAVSFCISNYGSHSKISALWRDSSTPINIQCRNQISDGTWSYALHSIPHPNCETFSKSTTIPTVADGIALGWQAGSALILVGCILFMKKALK